MADNIGKREERGERRSRFRALFRSKSHNQDEPITLPLAEGVCAILVGSSEPSTAASAIPSNEKEQSSITTLPVPDVSLGDRQRTERRYIRAVKQLEQAMNIENSEAFEIPDFTSIENDPVLQLRRNITEMIDARQNAMKERGVWSEAKQRLEDIFVTISPFARTILSVARTVSNVILRIRWS
jgi:hypothetical protein